MTDKMVPPLRDEARDDDVVKAVLATVQKWRESSPRTGQPKVILGARAYDVLLFRAGSLDEMKKLLGGVERIERDDSQPATACSVVNLADEKSDG